MSETHEKKETVGLGRYGSFALLAGIVGVAVLAVAMMGHNKTAWQAYLFGYIVWASMSLGCFGILLLFHTVNGRWGLPVMRIMEAAASRRNFALLAVLFIPLIYSIVSQDGMLYMWAKPEVDHIIQQKQAYLNPVGFTIRAFAFFLLWVGLSTLLRRSTLRQDREHAGEVVNEQRPVAKLFSRIGLKFIARKFDGVEDNQGRRSSWAAPGLVAFVLSITFAFTDWVMSLEPHWSSTMYGAWWVVGMGLMALAFVTIIATLNKDKEPYVGLINPSWTRDMGNLLLTFTMLWGYTTLSQYLIIWSGNMTETISFYVQRSSNHWNAIGMATVLGQFFIPFLCLLSPRIKAQSKLLAQLCGWILVLRLIDMYYVIVPAMRDFPMPSVFDVVALVGIGGLWVSAFSAALRKAPLLPSYDPRLREVEAHAH